MNPKPTPKRGLTPKQERFCQEYLIDLNATAAAIRAGYSEKTAGVQAAENLIKPNIQKVLAEAKAQRAKKIGRTAEDVLKDITETAKEAREVGDLKTALKGYELEGRHYGLFDKKAPDGEPTEASSFVAELIKALKP